MKYAAFIVTEGATVPEALTVMQKELPPWIEEMDRRGVRVLGRELDFPATAATVRVRDGETLVTDGPFAETKEFVAGFDVLECADLDEAIGVVTTSPVFRYHPFEIRAFGDGLRLSARVPEFAREDDSAGVPYLLTVWVGGTPAASLEDQAVLQEYDAWRQDLDARGLYILGSALGSAGTATTLRTRDGKTQLIDGPFLDTEEFLAGLDVVRCAEKQQAIEAAAAHPMARYHAIEVRPFYSE